MALANCDLCQRMFDAWGGQRRCQPCLEAQERDWKVVREYVKSHPGTNILVVADATEVPERRIREFIMAGLLEPSQMTGAHYPCRKCQGPIATGEYCPTCLGRLGRDIASSLDTVKQKKDDEAFKQRTNGFANQYRSKHR